MRNGQVASCRPAPGVHRVIAGDGLVTPPHATVSNINHIEALHRVLPYRSRTRERH